MNETKRDKIDKFNLKDRNSGKYSTYLDYKDSGIEWLGKIPDHWELNIVDQSCNLMPGYSFNSENFNQESGFPLIRIRNIKGESINLYYDGEITPEIRRVKVEKGDIIVGMDGDFNVYWWDDQDALLNQRMTKITSDNFFTKRYIYYVLPIALDYINDITASTTVKHLSTNRIRKLKIPKIPKEEQKAIVEFLDKETKKIDYLIHKKEKLINHLEEKRTAIITKKVTKGLDPKVEMKDSGIEWLGEIPTHWEIKKFRRFCSVNQGLQIAQSERFSKPGENRYKYLTVEEINAGEDYHSDYIENPPESVICDKNDVLLARTGATGEVISDFHGAFHNNFFKINFDRNRIVKNFLVYYLSNKLIKENLLAKAGLTTVPDLNHRYFLDTPFLLPPKSEQKKIVNHLDDENQQIDELIQVIKKAIEKLKEYRTALITNAVTGKIDVRGEV